MIRLNSTLEIVSIAPCCLSACTHTETLLRTMTWSTQSDTPALGGLPKGAVRLTFVQAPKFHVRLNLPSVREHLEASRKPEVSVEFEVHCKHRQFSMIRVRSVDGVPVRTGPDNMVLESGSIVPGKDPGPFPGACSY